MDWAALYAAALRAQAAYIIDPAQAQSAFEALGHTFIAQHQDNNSQAVVSVGSDGAAYLSISGTRFSAGKLGDLFDDVDLTPVDLGGGAKVTQGAYASAKEVFDWALSVVPDGEVLNVCGHSLGGWRTGYAPALLPASQIGSLYAFEPPKGANLAYYQKYQKELAGLVITGQGRDIWMNYPRLGDWIHRPGPMVWIQSIGYKMIDTSAWPGGFSLGDHSIDTLVTRLAAIVGSGVPA